MTDWNALYRLADRIGTTFYPVTIIYGKNPPKAVADNGGAQARCLHDDQMEVVVTTDGLYWPLHLKYTLDEARKKVKAVKTDVPEAVKDAWLDKFVSSWNDEYKAAAQLQQWHGEGIAAIAQKIQNEHAF